MQNSKNNSTSDNDTKNPFASNVPDVQMPVPVQEQNQPAPSSSDETDPQAAQKNKMEENIQWSIQDDVQRKRGPLWHIVWIAIIVVSVIVALVVHYFTGWWQLWSEVGLAVIIFLTLILVNRRPVGQIDYSIDNAGLSIGDKLHPFSEFRAFGVANVNGVWMATLIPTKRWAFATTMTLPDDQGEAIVDQLGDQLPMEEISPNLADELSRRLKL